MAKVRIHNNHIIPRDELQPMNVRRPEAELPSARLQNNALAPVDLNKLLRDFLGSVGGGVVDDDEFPVNATVHRKLPRAPGDRCPCVEGRSERTSLRKLSLATM